jgi:hypothetical protein
LPNSELQCPIRINRTSASVQAGAPLFQFRGITIFSIGDSLMTGEYLKGMARVRDQR